jgi:hypothetical protein
LAGKIFIWPQITQNTQKPLIKKAIGVIGVFSGKNYI